MREDIPRSPRTLTWRIADVSGLVDETPTVRTLRLDVPGWPGHRPGQHVDVRLTAADGYRAHRSYSIASAPDGERLETIEDIAAARAQLAASEGVGHEEAKSRVLDRLP